MLYAEMRRNMENRRRVAVSLARLRNRAKAACFQSWSFHSHQMARARALALKSFANAQRRCMGIWRDWLSAHFRLHKTAARRLQGWWRKVQKKLQNNAAQSLQSMWRGKAARRQLEEKRRRKDAQEEKVQISLRRIRNRAVLMALNLMHKNAQMSKRVKALAMRCMMSGLRVFFSNWRVITEHLVKEKLGAVVVIQKVWRGHGGRRLALARRRLLGGQRIIRNERVVRYSLRERFMRRAAQYRLSKWWRRSLLRWRSPLFLAWQRFNAARNLQRMYRGMVGRRRFREIFAERKSRRR